MTNEKMEQRLAAALVKRPRQTMRTAFSLAAKSGKER